MFDAASALSSVSECQRLHLPPWSKSLVLLTLVIHHVDEKLMAFKQSLDFDAIEAYHRGDHQPEIFVMIDLFP